MRRSGDNVIIKKSYSLALRIIKTYRQLAEKKEFILSKQLLRSGTSIGTNVHEAMASESKRDFVHKLAISLKESRETLYWLNLLKDSNYISFDEFDTLRSLCEEVIRILNSIILTTKNKYFPDIHNS